MGINDMARPREEKCERMHFEKIHEKTIKNIKKENFSPDLRGHPDHRIIKHGINQFSSIKDQKLVLLGCGVSKEAYYLRNNGAIVHGIDLSFNSLLASQLAANMHKYNDRTHFIQSSVYNLGVHENSIDMVYGHAILHHLDLAVSMKEVHRVLKPGGEAVFTEPLDENLLLKFTREHIPYPGKQRVEGEKAMRYRDFIKVEKMFSRVEYHESELLSMIGRVWRNDTVIDFLYKIDSVIFKLFPFTKRFSREVAVKFVK